MNCIHNNVTHLEHVGHSSVAERHVEDGNLADREIPAFYKIRKYITIFQRLYINYPLDAVIIIYS